MKEHLYSVLRAPHISEKSARLQENNQYVFEVAPPPTKADDKSMVWDPVKALAAKGYAVPKAWGELVALADMITAAERCREIPERGVNFRSTG